MIIYMKRKYAYPFIDIRKNVLLLQKHCISVGFVASTKTDLGMMSFFLLKVFINI